MVEFVEKFDFLSSITPHLEAVKDQTLSIEETNPRIVGQERNGLILYTWYSKQPAAKSKKWKTHISFFDITRQVSKLLFSHNDEIDIVNASVSQEFILLAFTVREKQSEPGNASPGDPVEIFKTYLAEIAPQKRVFSLNIEWHTYQKVQFLYKTQPSIKKIHLLFIHHKESIGLYHIPVAKLGDDGFVMSAQPKTEQIVRQFLWSKFDPIEQRLFFIQLNAQDEEDEDGAAMFNAIQFAERGEFKYILNFQLPISFKMELMRQTVKYFQRNLAQVVANKNLNIETLTSTKGALMICYQHQFEDGNESSDESRKSTPRLEDDTISACSMMQGNDKIAYTVCCIHGGYSMNCSISMKPSDVTGKRLLFSMFGDYLMVFLPGSFVHLLDCGSEHEPMHHILLSDDACPKMPSGIPANTSLFTPVIWDYVPAMHHGILLYENLSQKSYKVTFNHGLLIQIFAKTRQSTTRLAILHCAIIHVKDSKFAKKLVECLCQDPANIECSDLLKEYLVGYSYANMKHQLSYFLLKPLPFSCSESFRGMVERDRDSQRSVFLSYKKFRPELIDVLLKLLRRKDREYWSFLKQNIVMSQDSNCKRFPLQSLAFAGLQIEQKEPPPTLRIKKMQTSRSRAGSPASSTDSSRTTDDFPTVIERGNTKTADKGSQEDALAKLVTEKVSAHVLTCFPRENKGRVHNICAEYASCRGKIVRSLWRHLTKVLGYNSEGDVYDQPLEKEASPTDHALFQIIERLHLCIAQLCFPEFKDMQGIFIALGYRCLPQHMFIQYLNASVFTVRTEFVKRFIAEAPDTQDSVPIKMELISRLPKVRGKVIIDGWNHPIARRFKTQELLGRFYGEETSSVSNMTAEEQESEMPESERFLPLETFLRSIRIGDCTDPRHINSNQLTEEEYQFVVSSAHKEMSFLTHH